MVRTLKLNEETTKAFFVEGSKPLPLCNIRNLTLEARNLEDGFVPAMVYIFRGITTLNTLCMKSDIYKRATDEEDDATVEEDSESDGENNENKEADSETDADNISEEENNASKFDVEYWKSQNLTFTNELQEVMMEVVEGNDNELELARYILEHAQNLKKMVILHSPQDPHVVEMVSESKKISTATVVFKERRSTYL